MASGPTDVLTAMTCAPRPIVRFQIRAATVADMAAVAHIYSHFVLSSKATFEEEPPSGSEMAARFAAIAEHGLPYLVAEAAGGEVIGYSYASPYRARPAYRFTVENSVYVHHEHPHRGVGSALMRELIKRCESGPWCQMIAVIGDSANRASIGLHTRLGFTMIGTARDVGHKFGDWVD